MNRQHEAVILVKAKIQELENLLEPLFGPDSYADLEPEDCIEIQRLMISAAALAAEQLQDGIADRNIAFATTLSSILSRIVDGKHTDDDMEILDSIR